MSNIAKLDKPAEWTPLGSETRISLTISKIRKYLCKPTKSGALASDTDCEKFIMLCVARRLNPWEGDAFLVGYDTMQVDGSKRGEFSMITAFPALLKRAEMSKQFRGLRSGIILWTEDGKRVEIEGACHHKSEGQLIGAWAQAARADRDVMPVIKVDLAAFRQPTKFWDRDEAGMIVKCAKAAALREAFATTCGGLMLNEEIGDRAAIDIETGPVGAPVDDDDVDMSAPTPAAKPEPAKPAALPARKPHDELADLLTGGGYTFSDLVTVGEQTGVMEDADSYGELADVPDGTVKRLLRARKGVTAELEKAKAAREARAAQKGGS